jgi:hypothetical protein
MMGREVGRDEEPGVAGPREEGGRPNRELGEDMVGEDVGNDIQCRRIQNRENASIDAST